MRISDWSSDVCSSDLFFGGPGQSWLADAALGRSHQPGISVDDPIQKQNNFHLYPGIDVFRDRKSVVSGKSVSVRVDLGGRRIIKKKNRHRVYRYDNADESVQK